MEQLSELLVEILRIPKQDITDDLSIDDADGWDSLTHMQLVISVEKEFGIILTADDIIAMVSVKEIKRVLLEKGI